MTAPQRIKANTFWGAGQVTQMPMVGGVATGREVAQRVAAPSHTVKRVLTSARNVIIATPRAEPGRTGQNPKTEKQVECVRAQG